MATANHTKIIAEWQRSELALRAALLLAEADLYADAISRMYYAILHATTAALLSKGSDPATHRAARHLLNQHFVHTGEISREWLDYFERAMNNRRAADYDAEAVFTSAQMNEHRQQAEAFCARIHRYLPPAGRKGRPTRPTTENDIIRRNPR